MKRDVVGIGNCLMQCTVRVTDQELIDLQLKKGVMHLVDDYALPSIHQQKLFEASGDVANTMMGLASLGANVAFIGKVGSDEQGRLYSNLLKESGVEGKLATHPSRITGTVYCFISPDGERTMVTTLGAALTLTPDDILEEEIKNAKILYISGYLIEEETLYKSVQKAVEIAKRHNVKIAFDLADPDIVKRNFSRMTHIVKEYASILFANEPEATAFTDLAPNAAIKELEHFVDIAVIKLGKHGSLVGTSEGIVTIPCYEVDAVDTTGAGDMYSAGFLYGLTHGKSIEESGKLGSFMAACIVKQHGTTMTEASKLEVKTMVGEVRDITQAHQGLLNIEWAQHEMKALLKIKARFEEQKPFTNVRIGMALHVTKETAVLVNTLIAGGAEVAITSCNPLSTQDDVAAALLKSGVKVWAYKGESKEDYYRYLENVIACKPHITIDDGCDLVSEIHTKHPELIPSIIGGCEETTTGVIRLLAMKKDNALKYPIIAVNNNKTKHLLDNVYGTAQSTLDGVIRATNILLAGKTVVVCGYGSCGKGVSKSAKALGANVIVTEVDPFAALQARMDGMRVMPMEEAVVEGEVYITVTGNKHVITLSHMQKMRDGVILANSGHFDNEIDVKSLQKSSQSTRCIRPFMDEYVVEGKRIYLLGEGRLVNLAAAEGHPSAVMSTSFCGQALACEYLVKNRGKLHADVIELPSTVDSAIAQLQLDAMDIHIDTLTPDQQAYLSSWQEGT